MTDSPAAATGQAVRCEICGEPLDAAQPWQQGLDGEAAHVACVEVVAHDYELDEEER